MGFLDRLLGREDPDSSQNGRGGSSAEQAFGRGRGQRTDDEIALERYRYLLKTAPPETIEQVHAEAFARLTPEQRRQVYEDLAAGSDRPTGDDPESLARSATRSEIRQPGTLERAFGGNQGNAGNRGGPGFGSMVGSSILGTVAGYVIGSAIVSSFMPNDGYGEGGGEGSDGSADAGSADAASADSGDSGGWGGDSGGGWGDGGGGDFGGGDFGGGDF